jgi:hypothetical protein
MALFEADPQLLDRVFTQTGEYLGVGPGNPLWRIPKALSMRVLPDGNDDVGNGLLYGGLVYQGALRELCRVNPDFDYPLNVGDVRG